jgi:hypothetical protein
MGDTVWINLAPISAALQVARDAQQHEGRPINPGTCTLSYRVQLPRWQSIELSNGLKLEDIEGVLSVQCGEVGVRGEAEALGTFQFSPAWQDEIDPDPPRYHGYVNVTADQFRELVDAARSGLLPSSVGLQVTGLTYGGLPDGSHKKWDIGDEKERFNDRMRQLVRDFRFTIPLTDSRLPLDEYYDTAEELNAVWRLPISRRDLKAAVEAIAGSHGPVIQALKSLGWAIAIVALVYWVFRH